MEKSFSFDGKIVVLDFDHTCYDTDAFSLYEIREPLGHLDISAEKWQGAYESSVRQGYSLEKHRSELSKVMGSEPFSLGTLKDLEAKMDFGKYLYPDVKNFLRTAGEKGYKTMILSFGDPDWQHKKVSGSGLDKLVDYVEYTREDGTKADFLKRYASHCDRIIFVDNNGLDADRVHEVLPKAEVYFMNRVPQDSMVIGDEFTKARYMESRKMAQAKINFEHLRINSLSEIIL